MKDQLKFIQHKIHWLRHVYLVKPHNFFVFFAVIFGAIFLVIVPPFEVPDEQAHFSKAYQISQFKIVQDNVGKTSGGTLPKGLMDIAEIAGEGNLSTNLARKFEYRKKIRQLWHVKIDKNNTEVLQYSTLASYPPVAYLPQALAIGITSQFTDRAILIFYAGRLLNLAVMIVMLYFAIRIIPRAKWTAAVIGLMPMTLFVGASLSADAVTIGATALFAAVLMKMYYAPKVSKKWWFALGGTVIVLSLCKQAYFILTLASAVLLIDSQTGRLFKNKKELWDRLWKLAVIAVVAITLLLAWKFVSSHVSTDVTGIQHAVGHNVNPDIQTGKLLHHPMAFLRALLNTTFTAKGDGILDSLLGVFGWLNIPLPAWIMCLIVVLLFLSLGLREKTLPPRLLPFFVGILPSVLFFIATATALYILWTDVSLENIEGFQGRYIIPLLFLAAPFLAGRYSHTIRVKVLGSISIFILVSALTTIYSRY